MINCRYIVRSVFVVFFSFLSFLSFAQKSDKVHVKIDKADVLRHDDKVGKNTQSLNGNVVLSHVNTVLLCDSAYMYNDSNVVVAYGNIHVIQNDSIHLYGDKMTYWGNRNFCKIRDNVRANKGNAWLFSDYLDYDRLADVAYFYDGGKVVNGDNVLTAERGLYYPNSNDVYFKDNVVGTSPKYTLNGDTLRYNTKSEVITILGPTTIVNSDSTVINSTNGWYDTKTGVANLLDNSEVVSGHNTIVGNTIRYDRTKGFVDVYGQLVLTDTLENVKIFGDYGFFNQFTNDALVTRNAMLLHVYQNDTLFMHADTFCVNNYPEDSSKVVKAFYNVKFYRSDIQGRCDSLVFESRDSTATLYHTPIVWAQGNQMSANEIKLYTRRKALYKADLLDAAFVVSPEDSVRFNQVKGKKMTGHIRNNDLYRIDVDGNGQTIYYPKDDQTLIGVNRAESSSLSIWLENRKITNITMRVSPSGNMNPPLLLGEKDQKLQGFVWLDKYRPSSKDDIFLRMEIKEDVLPVDEIFDGFTFDELGE